MEEKKRKIWFYDILAYNDWKLNSNSWNMPEWRLQFSQVHEKIENLELKRVLVGQQNGRKLLAE